MNTEQQSSNSWFLRIRQGRFGRAGLLLVTLALLAIGVVLLLKPG